MRVNAIRDSQIRTNEEKMSPTIKENDAGASPTQQASQRGSGRQLDKPVPNFENTLGLLRKSLMKSFMKERLCVL
jgi:hypothetical protein